MSTSTNAPEGAKFLDMQAEIGVSKHIGGFESTEELLSLCRIQQAHRVLNVGCGTGVGSVYIAKKYGCSVVGIDLSEKMVDWSRRRAREEGVESLVEFQKADVLELPFEANGFDVVFAESVLIFIENKAQAIRECVRVVKPGGCVGLCEGYWIEQPPVEMLARVRVAVGPSVPTLETWQALWDASGLQQQVIKSFRVDAKTEVRSRMQWIGWRWLLRAWGRALRLYFANPGIRQAIKDQLDVPVEVMNLLGYGIFTGTKPAG